MHIQTKYEGTDKEALERVFKKVLHRRRVCLQIDDKQVYLQQPMAMKIRQTIWMKRSHKKPSLQCIALIFNFDLQQS